MRPPVHVDMPELRPQREEDMPKGAYIKKRCFEQFGFPEDCEGCRRLMPGVTPRRPHLESCRKRIYGGLSKTEEGRQWMGKTHIKMDEYLAERLGPRKPTVSSRPQERKDDGADSMERGGGKAEDVPVPTDADDEDMTLGEIFTKRKRARHDAPGATRPRGTQKRARRERSRRSERCWPLCRCRVA